MSVGKICSRTVYTANADEWIVNAAARMRDHDVGTLVVVDTQNLPIGILTDRDITLRCVAEGRDPEVTNVTEIMSVVDKTLDDDTPIETALSEMANQAVRRAVVTDEQGRLSGLLALDDVIDLLAEEAGMIGQLVRAQAH